MLVDNNYTNIEIALTRLSTLNPDKTKKYLEVTANEKGATNNIRITWLEIANRTNNNQYINELVNYSSSGYEFRTRNAAIGALVNLNYCDQAAVTNLYNALISSNHRLSTPARNALTKLKATPEYNKLIKDYYNSKIWSDWEQRKIGTIKD